MAIREDIVASAISFLQDPNVVSSPVENKLSFLQSKNLTQEEIDAAFARAGSSVAPTSSPPYGPVQQQQQQQQPYYAQYPPQPYPWQAPKPEPPKRDWRDWFIMATVMGGVGYGLYFITKRYITPLVAPPTPEKLDQDKATVDEQFEKAFATLEQLAKDTESLRESEKERTEKLDKVLEELESFMQDTKSAGRRQEDETERLREEMKSLKGLIPRSMTANKDFTDGRLKEIGNEVKSLKSLIGGRMSSTASAPSTNHLRPTSGNATPGSPAPTSPAVDAGATEKNGDASVKDENASAIPASKQDYMSSLGGRSSPFGSGMPASKAAIPAWQLAATKGADTSNGAQQESSGSKSSIPAWQMAANEGSNSSQQEAGSSS